MAPRMCSRFVDGKDLLHAWNKSAMPSNADKTVDRLSMLCIFLFLLAVKSSVHEPSTFLCIAVNSRSSPGRTYALARTEPPPHPRASLPASPKPTAVRCLGAALSIPRRSALARERGVFFPCFHEGVEVLVRRNGAAKLRVVSSNRPAENEHVRVSRMSAQWKADNKASTSGGLRPHVASVVENSLTSKRQPQAQSVPLACCDKRFEQ